MQSIGQILDGLGLQADLGEGDLINGCVVLMEVVGADGSIHVEVVEDDGASWVRRVGLLKIALEVALAEVGRCADDDDS